MPDHPINYNGLAWSASPAITGVAGGANSVVNLFLSQKRVFFIKKDSADARDSGRRTSLRSFLQGPRNGFNDGTFQFMGGQRQASEDNSAFQICPASGNCTGRATLLGIQN